MTADKIKNRINELASHFLFEYKGKECGVDPINHSNFDIWCGDNYMNAHSIDEVMETPFFEGKALNEICNEIDIVEW
jgi:hypothetical protein